MSPEVEAALRAGKFPASRAEHYERLMDVDPVGTRSVLAALAPVLPVQELGAASPGAAAAPGPAYPPEWLTPKDRKLRTELGGRVVFGDD